LAKESGCGSARQRSAQGRSKAERRVGAGEGDRGRTEGTAASSHTGPWSVSFQRTAGDVDRAGQDVGAGAPGGVQQLHRSTTRDVERLTAKVHLRDEANRPDRGRVAPSLGSGRGHCTGRV